jgi:hypothetical protein
LIHLREVPGTCGTATEVDAYEAVVGLVEGHLSEEEIALWIRTHSEPGVPG